MYRTFQLTLCLTLFAIGAYAEPFYKSEILFPFEHWHNHSSSIVECPDGTLLTVWFHGSGERQADDVLILGSRKAPDSDEWSEPFVAADTPGYPDCNPTLFIDPTGKLWLFWANILSNRWESALLKFRTSTDYCDLSKPLQWNWQGIIHITPTNFVEDMTGPWTAFEARYKEAIEAIRKKKENLEEEEEFIEYIERRASDKLQQRLGWMPRIHPLTLENGRILLPLYTDAYSVGIVAITDDNGETWQTSQPIVGYGNIQPALVEKRDGTVAAFMRENGFTKRIRYAESKDRGETWGPVTELDIPNPGSSVDCIRLQSGKWLLVCNDTASGRHSLNLFLSEDEGQSWKWTRHLELAEPGQGSFHYPSLIQGKNGNIHITYSHHLPENRKTIKHVEFNEEWIMAGDSE